MRYIVTIVSEEQPKPKPSLIGSIIQDIELTFIILIRFVLGALGAAFVIALFLILANAG